MSIRDLELSRTREDGKRYTTTIGTMHDDAQKQREKMHAKHIRKAQWATRRDKWLPVIMKGVSILGIVAIVGVLLYFLFWIIIGGVVLMAVGARMSEAGSEAKERSQYYAQQRYNRPTNNPKYWRD